MKILLATGYDDIDKPLIDTKGRDIVGEIPYREGIVDEISRSGAEIVIMSWFLPGQGNMLDIITGILKQNARPILLMGEIKPDSPEVMQSFFLGARDYIFNPVNLSELMKKIENPSLYSDAIQLLKNDKTEETKSFIKIFKKIIKKLDDDQNSIINPNLTSQGIKDMQNQKRITDINIQLQNLMNVLEIKETAKTPEEAVLIIEQKIINLL